MLLGTVEKSCQSSQCAEGVGSISNWVGLFLRQAALVLPRLGRDLSWSFCTYVVLAKSVRGLSQSV